MASSPPGLRLVHFGGDIPTNPASKKLCLPLRLEATASPSTRAVFATVGVSAVPYLAHSASEAGKGVGVAGRAGVGLISFNTEGS